MIGAEHQCDADGLGGARVDVPGLLALQMHGHGIGLAAQHGGKHHAQQGTGIACRARGVLTPCGFVQRWQRERAQRHAALADVGICQGGQRRVPALRQHGRRRIKRRRFIALPEPRGNGFQRGVFRQLQCRCAAIEQPPVVDERDGRFHDRQAPVQRVAHHLARAAATRTLIGQARHVGFAIAAAATVGRWVGGQQPAAHVGVQCWARDVQALRSFSGIEVLGHRKRGRAIEVDQSSQC